jgi:predicted Zn-ribbon and HTH transcriptional regulator
MIPKDLKQDKEVKEEPKMTREELMAEMQREEEQKVQAFIQEIESVCERHGYDLSVTPAQIVPVKRQSQQ